MAKTKIRKAIEKIPGTAEKMSINQQNQLILWTAVMAIAIVLEVTILGAQLYVILQQTQIIKQSNPPFDALIEIVQEDEAPELVAWRLTSSKDLEDKPSERGEIIDLRIFNLGKKRCRQSLL